MGEGNMSISPRWAIGRRGMVSGLAAGAALAPASLLPKPAWAGIPGNRKLAFEVFRNGKPVENAKGVVDLVEGDTLELGLPGGGGYGRA